VRGSTGSIMTWGNNQTLSVGSYLVVYRVQLHSEVESGQVCFLDVAKGGKTIGGRRPQVSEFSDGKWTNSPVVLELEDTTGIECRMWPLNHVVSLDRVYIFRLISGESND